MPDPAVKPTAQLEAWLAAIIELCQRYCTPAVNVGAHALAAKVIELAEGNKTDA